MLSDVEAGLEPSVVDNTTLSNQSVAVIILDVRTNRDPWPKGKYGWIFSPDYEGDFLGQEQWTWLEHVLYRSTASVNIIVQGLQVHPDRYFDGNVVESWGRFKMAQHRLYQAIIKSNVSVPVLVGGDVHKSELLRKDCRKAVPDPGNPNDANMRMLLEVTASGMTHSWGTNVCSRPDDKLTCRLSYIRSAVKLAMLYSHNNHCWTEVVNIPVADEIVAGRGQVQDSGKTGYQYALERNFGEFEFDWDNRQLIVRILGEDVHGKPLISTRWDFDLLSGLIPPADSLLDDGDFRLSYQELAKHGAQDDDWICVNYRHESSLPVKLFSVIAPGILVAFILLAPLITPLYLWTTLRRRIRSQKKEKRC